MLQPVIICGGEGKRLWPISRKKIPKQFLSFFFGKSLFELTIDRVKKLKNISLPIIVMSKDNENLVRNILKKTNLDCKILLEPEGKGTTAAIYLAAKESDDNDTLLILPSDHFFEDDNLFLKTINYAKNNILTDYWYIFISEPSHISTEYGYVKASKNEGKVYNITIKDVIEFIEKPSFKDAKDMISSGDDFWNSGIFMGNVKMIKKSIYFHSHIIASECEKVFKNRIIDNHNKIINFDSILFSNIISDSIDYVVLEKEEKIKCIQLNTKWSDLGSWDVFLEYIDEKKFKENIVQINGENSIFNLDNRIIGTVGINDLIIIDSKEATLITQKSCSKYLPQLMAAFKKENIHLPEILSFDERPWGRYDVLLNDDILKVKRLTINPKQSISLQFHNKRSEHWVIISGIADVFVDGNLRIMKVGESVDIPKKVPHSLCNNTNEKLIIIEVQMGEYFGEDDIIRLSDPYNRV